MRRCNASGLMGRSGNPVGVICPGRSGSTSLSSPDSSVEFTSVISISSFSLSCAGVAGKCCRRLGIRIPFIGDVVVLDCDVCVSVVGAWLRFGEILVRFVPCSTLCC